MHFGNYISTEKAKTIVEEGVSEITLTKTALKQTSVETISFLELNGVLVTTLQRRGRPRKISQKELEQILAMRKSSKLSLKAIGDMMNIPKSTVFDCCKEYDGRIVEEESISLLQRDMAHSMFKKLLSKDLCDEVNALSSKGLVSNNVSEMEFLMREIEDIVL